MPNNEDWWMDNFEICRFTSGAFVPPLNLPMRWCLSHRCDLWQWTRGRLTVLIWIINCITMRKTLSAILMMITGFSAPPIKGTLSPLSFSFFFFYTGVSLNKTSMKTGSPENWWIRLDFGPQHRTPSIFWTILTQARLIKHKYLCYHEALLCSEAKHTVCAEYYDTTQICCGHQNILRNSPEYVE